jgi:hypothetical protein
VDIPGRRGLGGLDRLEQLSKDPHQRVVILAPENLGHKQSILLQEFRSQLQRLQHQLVLREGILNPSGSDVGSTIVEYQVRFPVVQMRLELLSTVRRRDIGDKSRDVWKRSNRVQIDTDNQRSFRHVPLGYLQPSSRSGTQIDTAFRVG